jgi:hypothetical protein
MNSFNAWKVVGAFLLLAMLIRTPAFAQTPGIDFSGEWTQWVQDGEADPRDQETGNILNIPYNEAGRQGAEIFNLSLIGAPEWQCRPHPGQFFWRGTGQNRISKVVDVVSRETTAFRVERRRNHDQLIWLDGRPHPPEDALHTWGGFSTGKWIGNMLEITTTHLKDGYYAMNGEPASDQATIMERWIRHGEYLSVFQTITDPIYLEEPYITSQMFRLDLEARLPPSPCIPIDESPLERGQVSHFLPGQNPYWFDFVDEHNIPRQVLKDGAARMYPEYQQKIKQYRTQK